MLKLNQIRKSYKTGADTVEALKGIDLEFRKSEFVSILGPSGCGKTTLLNIIGGLDHYSDGDLIIKGKSTKKYSEHEWDSYRNHSVGFVFQSYNLIPHQTVLANVELALTLSGVGKSERRRRATEALKKVGLGDQINKKPTQMSGGQMQRVAIARAIVNDPEILLADEPTGALDSETSVQVMEILKEIAKDRLVIMVTHNPDLAKQYSTRIINLFDGVVTGDTMPYSGNDEEDSSYKTQKTRSMSFFTALGLSINNLLTKKGRTIMTCFAGSIGIIGIALILSVSNGVNIFIDKVQEDTLTKYPLTIESEPIDLSAMLSQTSGGSDSDNNNSKSDGTAPVKREKDRVYASNNMSKLIQTMMSVPTSKNNIVDFKKHIESNPEFSKYTSAIRYSYNIPMNFYTEDMNGNIVKADSGEILTKMYSSMGITIGSGSVTSSMMSAYSSSMNVWEELLSGQNGELISPMVKEQYDLLPGAGKWPENKNEVVLIVDSNNQINDFVLYALGMKSSDELGQLMKDAMLGKEIETTEMSWSYDEIVGKEFHLILPCDMYEKNSDTNTYNDLSQNNLNILYGDKNKYIDVKISGIVKPNENAMFNMLSASLGYTSALTDYIIEKTADNPIVKEQLANKDYDIITGLPFSEMTNENKVKLAKEYVSSLDSKGKASLYTSIMGIPPIEMVEQQLDMYDKEQLSKMIIEAYEKQVGSNSDNLDYIKNTIEEMTEEELKKSFKDQFYAEFAKQYAIQVAEQFSQYSNEELAVMMEGLELTDDICITIYDNFMPQSVSESTYEDNLAALGYVDKDDPKQIILYASTFNDKNKVSDLVAEYNSSVSEENQIKMTDYVKLLMSSVSTVINAVTYVLIAFVGISLVVSSIMIGVITNISVLERTKEIGILRAVGASKSDVGRVFNAETFIIGLLAGIIGIGVTLILIIPINIILHHFTDIAYLNASLPLGGAIILIILSMILTIIAGFIPSRSASKKDPVIALRSE